MSLENPDFEFARYTEIRQLARQRWTREQLPRLLFIVHLMIFALGSMLMLILGQQLWKGPGFLPAWVVIGWMFLLILHWGGTKVWSSYNQAVNQEVELAYYRGLVEKRKHTEADARLRVGDDGELVEILEDENYLTRQTKAKH